MTAYNELEARFRRLGAVEEAIAMLHWDAAATMPSGGAGARTEQLATLRGIAHRLLAAPEIGDLLEAAETQIAALGPWQRANVREMRRRWRHAAALPDDLVETLSRARSESEIVWRAARPANDFAMALPGLERVLDLTREVALAKAEALDTSPYEALLDQYEPDLSTSTIDTLFGKIAGFVPALLEAALAKQASRPAFPEPQGPFPIPLQRRAALTLMERIGFDFAHGRLDESAHPFCGGTPDDVRLTTRYDESDFAKALMGTLHETGHAMYKRGLPTEWRLQPVGMARGMAVHESQSLFLEMQVCRSRAFAGFAAPILRDVFSGSGKAWEPDALYWRQIRVQPGPIRVDADEVTYPAHIILRYRLERAMLAGDLLPRELPAAWAEGLRGLIGVVPKTDRDGCLQDIHWYDGAWGYFPTYTVGALIAAQLFTAVKQASPDIGEQIGRGEFAALFAWLREHVHSKGSLLSTTDLVQEATGQPLGAAAFERHLRERYCG
ncbi:MAG: carboxypeptidase M32 [Alphaproteobacteria bacterium]|nr:carboxypeptidase M32 [Alphaproteobacteria bacterium]